MKLKLIFSISLIFVIFSVYAQSPEKISYQAVIRDSNGVVVSNQAISVKISVLLDEPTGETIYSEIHNISTGESGLISIAIGAGTTSNDFTTIEWDAGTYFLKTETDPDGGTNYVITGTTQLLSVPYALYSKKAENFDESDPIFESSTASGINESDTASWNNKLDSYTESDPIFESSTASGINESDTASWNNKLDSYTESDPIFESSTASGINESDTASWNNKLDSYTESDPIFESSTASGINESDTASWNNKLDSYTESDPIFESSTAKGITQSDTIKWNENVALVSSLSDRIEALEQNLFTLEFESGKDSISDIDGNYYGIIKVGDQYWMSENLKTTKFNDGTTINLVTDESEWSNLNTAAYTWYNNQSSFSTTYGALYNWYVISSESSVCPQGWRVPSQDDWSIITEYLGGTSSAGGKLKETGTTNWSDPNTGATNEVNFTALPGGWRRAISFGDFDGIGDQGNYWSSTQSDDENAFSAYIFRHDTFLGFEPINKTYGISIRCVRD